VLESVESCQAIAQAAAASNLKQTCLELGGKSPHIIFPDCDFEQAAANVLMGFTTNMGQGCCCGTRVYVHEDIYERFLAAVAALAQDLTAAVGNPDHDSTQIGPLANPTQFERVSR
jgi:aldehyde dehydrogenase (NAD+)